MTDMNSKVQPQPIHGKWLYDIYDMLCMHAVSGSSAHYRCRNVLSGLELPLATFSFVRSFFLSFLSFLFSSR